MQGQVAFGVFSIVSQPVSMIAVIALSIQLTKSMLQNHPSFGSVRFTCLDRSASASGALDSGLLQPELDCDSTFTQSSIVEGELHIVLHPAYLVPCPYLRAWRGSGQLLSAEEMQVLLSGNTPSEEQSADKDHRVYHMGTLLPDMHPVLDQLYCTLHACDVSNRMTALLLDSKQHVGGSLYLLTWLGWLGPYLGLRMAPELYRSLALQLHDTDTEG